MRDKYISELNSFPQVIPDLFLRRSLLFHKVATNLDVRTIDDWDIGPRFFDQGNETRHLRVIDNDDIGSASSKRASLRKPISSSVISNPMIHLILAFLGQTNGRVCDTCHLATLASTQVTLKNIVIVLGDSEHLWIRLRNVPVCQPRIAKGSVPFDIHAKKFPKSNQRVTH